MKTKKKLFIYIFFLVLLALYPFIETYLPPFFRFGQSLISIFVFALLGLGLNFITGFTGMLHLGIAASMAIGAYTYAILSSDIYPFQLGFWASSFFALLVSSFWGGILCLPALRLRGDYLAIVTLGFGEIIQDLLRNLEVITKGTQGINPLPAPNVFGYLFVSSNYVPFYYLYLLVLAVFALLAFFIEHTVLGRCFKAVREDEIAASCMGVSLSSTKLVAFLVGSAYAGLAGALWVSYLGSTGEPGNYDFQVSIIALCILIVGGLGSVKGVIAGAFLMIGFNSIILVRFTDVLSDIFGQSQAVYLSPSNWKYFIFGMALVLMMRFRPQGLFGNSRVK